MPITEGAYTVLNQIPLAGIVVIVVFVFLFFMDKWLKAEREARGLEATSMRAFLADERKQSSDFLREQREGFNSTISRLAEKIDSISGEVSRLNGVLTAHDARAQERDRK